MPSQAASAPRAARAVAGPVLRGVGVAAAVAGLQLAYPLYLQFAGRDQFVPPETRAAFAAANPKAKVSLYDRADHFLNQPAKDDRLAFVENQLGL